MALDKNEVGKNRGPSLRGRSFQMLQIPHFGSNRYRQITVMVYLIDRYHLEIETSARGRFHLDSKQIDKRALISGYLM